MTARPMLSAILVATEVLQSEPQEGFPGGAKVPSFTIVLQGARNDGTSFNLLAAGQLVPGVTYPETITRTFVLIGLEDIEQQRP